MTNPRVHSCATPHMPGASFCLPLNPEFSHPLGSEMRCLPICRWEIKSQVKALSITKLAFVLNCLLCFCLLVIILPTLPNFWSETLGLVELVCLSLRLRLPCCVKGSWGNGATMVWKLPVRPPRGLIPFFPAVVPRTHGHRTPSLSLITGPCLLLCSSVTLAWSRAMV